MFRVYYSETEQAANDGDFDVIDEITHDEAAVLESLILQGKLPMLGQHAHAVQIEEYLPEFYDDEHEDSPSLEDRACYFEHGQQV